ncbi:hypothetical protein [Rhizobium phaseoli]|uniref:hypothetical protein n=1 Tax=Rhizobium phaseoli TaxID=396 RepID=UPI0007E95D79|nr:hypothetical protein [Rhizobium phaseoli]
MTAIDTDKLADLEQRRFRMTREPECLTRLGVQELAFDLVLLTASVNGQNDNKRPLALMPLAKGSEAGEASSAGSAEQLLYFSFAAARWSVCMASIR